MCCIRLEKAPSVRCTKDEEKEVVKSLLSSLSLKGMCCTRFKYFQYQRVIYLKFRGKTEKEMNNLRQEIEILKGLYHENIILLLDSFETSHEFCVVTEFAQGELFEILEDDRNLGEPEVRKIA